MKISTHHIRNKIPFVLSTTISLWSREIFSNQFKLTVSKLSFLKARDSI